MAQRCVAGEVLGGDWLRRRASISCMGTGQEVMLQGEGGGQRERDGEGEGGASGMVERRCRRTRRGGKGGASAAGPPHQRLCFDFFFPCNQK